MCGKMLSGSKSLISSYACIRMKDRPFGPPRHEEAAAITPADSEWRAESRELLCSEAIRDSFKYLNDNAIRVKKSDY